MYLRVTAYQEAGACDTDLLSYIASLNGVASLIIVGTGDVALNRYPEMNGVGYTTVWNPSGSITVLYSLFTHGVSDTYPETILLLPDPNYGKI